MKVFKNRTLAGQQASELGMLAGQSASAVKDENLALMKACKNRTLAGQQASELGRLAGQSASVVKGENPCLTEGLQELDPGRPAGLGTWQACWPEC